MVWSISVYGFYTGTDSVTLQIFSIYMDSSEKRRTVCNRTKVRLSLQ